MENIPILCILYVNSIITISYIVWIISHNIIRTKAKVLFPSYASYPLKIFYEFKRMFFIATASLATKCKQYEMEEIRSTLFQTRKNTQNLLLSYGEIEKKSSKCFSKKNSFRIIDPNQFDTADGYILYFPVLSFMVYFEHNYIYQQGNEDIIIKFASCLLHNLFQFEDLENIYRFIIAAILISMPVVEMIRLYFAFEGNMREKVNLRIHHSNSTKFFL